MAAGEEEKCRDNDESLEFAVLEAIATEVARAKKVIFCMRMRESIEGSSPGEISSTCSSSDVLWWESSELHVQTDAIDYQDFQWSRMACAFNAPKSYQDNTLCFI